MDILKHVISFFQRPFPPSEDWPQRLKTAVGVGFFVALFLYIFEPFGFNFIKSGKFLICVGFGATTLIVCILFELLMVYGFRLYDNLQHFTFGKWVLEVIGLILTISMGNLLFGAWVQGSLEWSYFPQVLYSTFLIGIFPVVILGSFAMLSEERKYREIALRINIHSKDMSESSMDELRYLGEIPISNIRYLESYQNYIKIGYLDAANQIKESMQRATLKSLEMELEGTEIVKCHRSYLVNRETIVSVSGNAQGLILALEGCDKEVPVSRSFVPQFR